MLRSLKMHGMAQAVGEGTEQGSRPSSRRANSPAAPEGGAADRSQVPNGHQLKAARLPNYHDLTGFDFVSSEVNEARLRQLHRCEFLETPTISSSSAGPARGSTHLATAIGVQAIEQQALRQRHHHDVISFGEWATVSGDAKMTTALLNRLNHRCYISKPKQSFRFKNSSAKAAETHQG